MTSKITIPERFIRKAWFIVLRHMQEHPAFYKDVCKELGISNSNEILSLGIEILNTLNFELNFNDDIEEEWHCNGSIKINFVARILHGYEAKICTIINNKILKGRVKAISNTQNFEKLSKGGIAQTVFNIAATKWQRKIHNNQITVEDGLIEGVNSKKITMLYEFIKDISIFYPKEIKELECEMDFLKKEIEKEILFQTTSIIDKEDISGSHIHNKIWSKTNNFPKSLFNTKWLRYERRDSFNLDSDDVTPSKGFSIGCVEFIAGNKKFPTKEISINLDTNNVEIINTLQGICRFESDTDYLFIEMNKINDTNEEMNNLNITSLYILNINRIDLNNQEAIIGYHMFYSLIKHKYLVKTTLFIRFREDQNFEFKPKLINSSDSEYKNINIFIRKFFANRSLNRLTIPSTTISHITKNTDKYGTLYDFLSKQGKAIGDVILRGCIGTFRVFYYYKKTYPINNDLKYLKGVRQDKFLIEYDDELCELRGTFIHKDKEIYKGKGFRKNRTIQFLLEQTNSTNSSMKKSFHNGDNDRKVVYFAFPVPSYDEVFFEDEIKNNLSFEGVLSGIDDEKALPLSFSALLVKEDISFDLSNPNDKMTKKLLFHFKKLSATYLATENIFNHFSD